MVRKKIPKSENCPIPPPSPKKIMVYPLVFLLKSGRDYEVRYFRIDARQSNAPTANFMIKITLSKRTDTKTHFDQDIYHGAHYLPEISHDLR